MTLFQLILLIMGFNFMSDAYTIFVTRRWQFRQEQELARIRTTLELLIRLEKIT